MKATLLACVVTLGVATPAMARADHARRPFPAHPQIGFGMHSAWYDPFGGAGAARGVGAVARVQVDPKVMLEGNATFFQPYTATSLDPVTIQTLPAQLSILGYLTDGCPFHLYGLGGVTVESTSLYDDASGDAQGWVRSGLHAGFGGEMEIGRLALEIDGRWIFYERQPSDPSAPAHPFAADDARLIRIGMSLYF